VVLVVPAEKAAAVGPAVLVAAEAVGEVWSVLEGAKLRF
jgi:hypothetical protein